MESWTPKRAAAKSKRKIEAIKKQMLARKQALEEIANEFIDVDMFVVTVARDAIAQLECEGPFVDALNDVLAALAEASKLKEW